MVRNRTATDPWRTPALCRWCCCLLLLVLPAVRAADPTACQLCGQPFDDLVYLAEDKVADEKLWACGTCVKVPHRCFACSLPVVKDRSALSDGRDYCARDFQRAVIANDEIFALVQETQQQLGELFRDQLKLPVEKTDIRPVDRVTIESLFARPGNDFRCPNILGYYQTVEENGERRHDISLLAGLTATGTRAVYAHELAHAWIADNVPSDRALGRDAKEGFCEWIAYLLMERMNDAEGMRAIEQNAYTRGQFARFRAAQQAFSIPDVIEWMRRGRDALLDDSDAGQVLRTARPAAPVEPLWRLSSGAAAAAETTAAQQNRELRLKGVVGSDQRRTALINDRAFAAGETGRIQLGTNKVEVRVIEIGPDFVRIRRAGQDEEETLRLNVE